MDPQLKQLLDLMTKQQTDHAKQQADSQAAIQLLMSKLGATDTSCSNAATLASSLDNRIGTFLYDPEAGLTFEHWHKRYGTFIEVDGGALQDSAKVRLLVGKLGDGEYVKFTDSILPDTPDSLAYADAIAKLKALFADSRSLIVRQFECLKLKQVQGQDVSSFIAQVNASCENSKLELTKEELKCLLMVAGLRDDHHDLRQRCLQLMEAARKKEEALTLVKLAEECRAFQLIRDSAQSLANFQPSSVNAIHSKPQQWKEHGNRNAKSTAQPSIHASKPLQANSGENSTSYSGKPCDSCGETGHKRSDCRFRNAICHKCQRPGHIAKACRSKPGTGNPEIRDSVQTNVVSCLATQSEGADWLEVQVEVNDIPLQMKLDTASQIAIFTTATWALLGKPALQNPEVNAKSCDDQQFQLQGKFDCSVTFNGCEPKLLVGYVSDSIAHDLLGIPWIEQLAILPPFLMRNFRPTTDHSSNSSIRDSSNSSASSGHVLRPQFASVHSVSAHQNFNKKTATRPNSTFGAKLPSFAPGEPVYILNFRSGKVHWLPGQVVEQLKDSSIFRVDVPSLRCIVTRPSNRLRRRLPPDSSSIRDHVSEFRDQASKFEQIPSPSRSDVHSSSAHSQEVLQRCSRPMRQAERFQRL